jgi:hypothetical protein
MGCPVHVWVPLMAAAAPFARIARDRFLASTPRFRPPSRTSGGNVRTVQRFAPVAQLTTTEPATATAEQAR